MAEPLLVLKTISEVTSTINTLSNAVERLWALRMQWQNSDFKLCSITNQLNILKSGLMTLRDWMNNKAGDFPHQFTMDLDATIACCSHLASMVESKLSTIETNTDGWLLWKGKIKLMFNDRFIKYMTDMIQAQTNAVSFLLQMTTYSSNQQKATLERKQSRTLFKRIQEDAASLIVLRDANSFVSGSTDNGSKLSKEFTFDNELWKHPVYQKAMRGNLVNLIRRKAGKVQKDATQLTGFMKTWPGVVVIGKPLMRYPLLEAVLDYRGRVLDEDVFEWRRQVKNFLRTALKHITDQRDEDNLELNSLEKACLHELQDCRWDQASSSEISARLSILWSNKNVIRRVLNLAPYSATDPWIECEHLLESIHSALKPDYSPSWKDVLSVQSLSGEARRFHFETDSDTFWLEDRPNLMENLMDEGATDENRRSLSLDLRGTLAIVYTIDLDRFDHISEKDPQQYDILDSILHLRKIYRLVSPKTRVIILCHNQRLFEKRVKLNGTSFKQVFPDYTGPNNPELIHDFLVRQCLRDNPYLDDPYHNTLIFFPENVRMSSRAFLAAFHDTLTRYSVPDWLL